MSDEMVCKRCGHHGKPESKTRGSFWIEVVLWLCFIIPGLVYSLWRLTTRGTICPKCGSEDLLPIDSPLGKKLMQEVAPAALANVEAPYRTTTGAKGGIAWRLGKLVGQAKKR